MARRRTSALVLPLAVAGALLGLAGPAAGYARPGETTTVPQTQAGVAKQCCVYGSAISGDGSRVVFQSANADIVPGGTFGSFDTYVRDFTTGVTRRVSVATDGTPSVGGRQYPNIFGDVTNVDISADGRYVAFISSAANLVPGDTNGTWDVFVRDLVANRTERVSVGTGGTQLASGGVSPNISADGRYVAFASDGLFVRDRTTGVTERVDVSSTEEPANFYGYGPSVSDDGRWVAFQSSASNLVTDPTEAVFASGAAIYLRDRVAGTTIRVTGPAQDTKANGYSWMPDISGDGRYVAYYSAATDLVPQDTNRADDVFVYDRVTRATRRVSVASDGSQASPAGSSHAVAISRDGRFVSFTSAAVNLVPGDTNVANDVFVHDLQLGTTERVSDGTAADMSAISADGSFIAVETTGTGVQSVQRRLRGAPVGVVSASASRTATGIDVAGTAGFAGAVISAADDPASPAPTVSTAGADLSRVELAVRPESEDLRVRLVTPGLPSAQVSGLAGRLACFETGCPPSISTSPYVGYRVDFSVAGVPHRLVVSATGAVLSQCASACVPLTAGTAQVGGTGQEVVVTVPLSALGGAHDQSMTGITAASTLLGSATGTTQDLDTVSLPNAALAAPKVQVAIAPAGVTPATSDYTGSAAVTAGSFSASIVAPATDAVVWLRPCVGSVCGRAVSRPLQTTADPVVPETQYAVLLPLVALGLTGAVTAQHVKADRATR